MRINLLILLCIAWLNMYSQQNGKKPLSIEDFGSWNTLSGNIISDDGNIIAFIQKPQKGDGMLIINREGKMYDTIPRGFNVQISPESNFAVFKIAPAEEQVISARRAKVKEDEMPGDSLGIFYFTPSSQLYKFPNIKSYEVPDENARWIAFSLKPDTVKQDSVANDSLASKKSSKDSRLVLFEVATTDTIMLQNVSSWVFARQGASVWFSKEKKDSTGTYTSIYAFDTATRNVKQVFSEKGHVENLVTDKQGLQCAFLFSRDTISEKKYALYKGSLEESPRKIIDEYSAGMPIGWSPAKNGNIFFSDEGNRIYFRTAETPRPQPKDTIPEEEKPQVDVWSWHDEKLQSQQLVEASAEKNRTYQAVFHLADNRMVQLADPLIKNVTTTEKGEGDIALGYNNQPYILEESWTGNNNRDYYIIDVRTGDRREIADNKSYVRISPRGNYVIWYEPADSGFYARSTDIKNMDAVPLTRMIPVSFYEEMHDRPNDPSPYGIAGWSEDERFVYIYDRYDIWRIDPAGERVPVCMTKAYGRRNAIRLRYLKLDADRESLSSEEDIILTAFDERNMAAGFFKTSLNTAHEPQLLLMDSNHYSGVRKAKKAERLIWTRESVKEFPNLWTSNTGFAESMKVSDANPQQDKFLWADVQLVEWTSFSGEKLKGMLYLPENLNTTQKYPMLVYFYERSSENLHKHQHPAPSRSTINKTFYASNGYIVFVPDITYLQGYPGQSAYNAVVSGTQYLLNTFPFIDGKRVGLQGQSWGGYQIAYLITQTGMYAAAMAGAPVSNMTSAYGGIRWETGKVRMFQYERQQSRIGGTLWEKPLQYIENSPLFFAPKVNTPLLMMHNDNDGAVPWSQGIEFFVALRRLGKPVWMLNYNNEPHNLKSSSWANRIDLSSRMFQFFNHYLKGYPSPQWMERGIPATEKGENLGY